MEDGRTGPSVEILGSYRSRDCQTTIPRMIFNSGSQRTLQMREVLLSPYYKKRLPKQKGKAKRGAVLGILGGKSVSSCDTN